MKRVLKMLMVAVPALTALAACSPLGTLNALTPSSHFSRDQDIAYGTDPRQRLDIYRPTGTQNAPVVVFFYGGNWTSGDRDDYLFVGEALAARGITTVVVDYRLSPQVTYSGFLDDSARALAWTRAHIAEHGGNRDELFVMGHSAGGYNAAMVAMDPRWLATYGEKPAMLRGWIGLAGPYDFTPITGEDIKPAFLAPNTPPDSQPINHVGEARVPALLLAGGDDKTVDPVRNTRQLAEKLRAVGVPVQTDTFDGIGHAMMIGSFARPLRFRAPVLDRVVAYVEQASGSQAMTAPATR
ncbi:alpha/beta hydrolase [Pigmentiphaga aceris]|uniref:Alpha/beta hydrolase n=1 Tax=Pigmentiphaga aceris TaxID=1940612 RepID=A0A5C0ATB3_9BURK|nr:alpha/beta hydrolase [Pigmentiphaga aceris]QEI05518.1 alpha/beta hydrolase [Pigmentiphaga aceris]